MNMQNTANLNTKINDKGEKILLYIFSPLCVLGIILFCFLLRGIYPFGNITIDFHDMGREMVPFYYHVYDYMHGMESSFYDWHTALGMNMTNGSSGCSSYSLFNIFFLFVSRERILESMSIFLMLKTILMSMAFSYSIRKIIPNSDSFIKFAFSVGYGLCGYVLMNYTVIMWLDLATFFPLLIAFMRDVIRDGKIVCYVCILALCLVESFYIGAMMLVYMFFGVGLYLVINKFIYRNSKNINLVKFGFATILGALLSCVVTVPHAIQTFSSTRYSNNSGIKEILGTVYPAYISRLFALLGLSLAFVIIFKGAVTDVKRNRKQAIGRIIWIFGMIFMSCAELLFENVNLIMHFGSYIHYPIRNGFVIFYTVAMCAAYYSTMFVNIPAAVDGKSDIGDAGCEKKMQANMEKSTIIRIIVPIVFVVAEILLVAVILFYNHINDVDESMVLKLVFVVAVLSGVSYFVVIQFGNRRTQNKLILATLISELLIYTFIFIGPLKYSTNYTTDPEQESEYIRISNQLKEEFNIADDAVNRIKNPDESLNCNYGMILKRAAFSNSTNLVPEREQQNAVLLGYSIQFTRLLDAGGTIFTDALMHVNNVITLNDADGSLYTKVDEADVVANHITGEKATYKYYESNYKLPFAMKVSSASNIESMESVGDIINFHNAAYGAINRGESAEFVTYIGPAEKGNNEIDITGDKLLYFVGGCTDQEYRNLSIKVNGKVVGIPTLKDNDNVLFPAHFNNNTVYLGRFNDEKVNVELIEEQLEEEYNYATNFFVLDMDLMKELCDKLENDRSSEKVTISRNQLTAVITTEDEEYVLLPVSYNDGFTVCCNGNKINAIDIKGIFTAVPVVEGTNEIILTFVPVGMRAGFCMTLLAIALLVGYVVLNKKTAIINRIDGNVLLYNAVSYSYIAVWFMAFTFVYVITVLNCIFKVI